MGEDRYRVLQDAITKARRDEATTTGFEDQNAHLDTLQAILDRHPSFTKTLRTADCVFDHGHYKNDPPMTVACYEDVALCQGCSIGGTASRPNNVPWPCPDALTVETALRNMGAIND